MSSYLAVATVTATLAHVLTRVTRELLPGVSTGITTEQPSKFKGEQKPRDNSEAWVNIFAYQVETDASLRNADLPTRSQNGRLVQRSQTALKINYLLTFYGDEEKLEPQQLLGKVVSTLHANPVIVPGVRPEEIAQFQHRYPFVTDPNLMGQHTRVRLTPLPLNLEDLSRLWSVLFQTEYRLSVIYQASVVLVTEEEPAPQPVLPVRERQIFVVPTLAPVIQTLSPATVLPSGQLTIHAQHVQGGKVQVVLDDQLVVPPDKVTLDPAGHLLITALPPELQAGVHTLRVAHTVDTGSAAAPDVRRCGESNVVAFVVQPHIIAQPAFAKPLLTLTVEPPVQPEQAVTLWLDEIAVALGHSPQVYGLLPQARQEPGNTLTFDVSQVTPGTYQLRVRVDRAEGPAEPAMTWTCSADPVVTP